jgi:LuxR family maltose regulon positive regulatory protein
LTTSTGFPIPKYFESIGYYLLGAVAYERNQLDEAKQHFLNGESRRSEAPALIDHATAAGLAQLEMVQRDLSAAERYAGMARSIAVESGSSMLLRISEAVERHIANALGRPPDLAISPPPVHDFTYLSILQPSHSWAWFQVQSPSIESRNIALDVVVAALERAEMHGVQRRAIQLSALRALALDALRRRDEALTVLEAALRRGADLGLVRSFVDLGQGLRPLLLAVAERHPGEGNVEAILEAFEAQGRQILVQTEPPEVTTDARVLNASAGDDGGAFASLTNRELDVLELLARRLTNKEIAARLGISAGTVKMHTLGIYRKLEVRGRRQAVAEALERGILTG